MSEKEWLRAGQQVIRRLNEAHHDAYFVGGCVRDLLLNRALTDIDIATSATTDEMERIFEKMIPVGEKHGTMVVREAGYVFEVTTYRGEVQSIAEDLNLRDFTMNALAMNKQLQLVDPHCFYSDLQGQAIRFCSPASKTISADPLRMLRAVRFQSQLRFHLDKQSLQEIRDNITLLRQIPVERIVPEIEKIWAGKDRKHALKRMIDLGYFEPNLFLEKKTIIALLKLTELALYSAEELWSLIAIIQPKLKWRQIPIKREIKKLIHKRLELFVRRVEEGWSNLLLYDATAQQIEPIERYYQLLYPNRKSVSFETLQLRYQKLPIHSRKELTVSGAEIVKHLKVKAGRWVESVLREIEHKVLEEKVENKQELLLYFVESEWRKQ